MKPISLLLLSSLLAASAAAQAKPDTVPPDPSPSTDEGPVLKLENFVVSDHLDQARQTIMPSLGASTFTMDQAQIELEPLGENAAFSQVILRAPGVAQDSAANGDLHVRGEHANLQYRINNVLLPEGISGFGLELDPRFVGSMQLVTGSLPAQYGFRTAGVVDIQTKSGQFDNGGEVEGYGGSFDTTRASFERSGSAGATSFFVDGSVAHNGIGIENPTPSLHPLHDDSDQLKAFAYLSHVIDETSRLSFMASASSSSFQVPDTPGLAAGTAPDGQPWLPGPFDSGRLNERQEEQNLFGVVAYEKTANGINLQTAAYVRYSGAHFHPDPVGDLYFNGVASEVNRRVGSLGFQADASDALNDRHTLRAGLMALTESLRADTITTVFPVDADGNPTGAAFPIVENGRLRANFLGSYLQDEWKLAPGLTLNYGARVDLYDSTFDREAQVSPRANLIYEASKSTTLHAGYSRYFTPPPLEFVAPTSVTEFNGTSNAAASTQDDPVRSERADYLDIGVTQKIGHGFSAGIDTYYKSARNQLDDGLFGQSLILSAFNYRRGRVFGAEFTCSYTAGGFSAYGNYARSNAQGKDWTSAQFQFDPADLAYVRSHWIFLDHDQQNSASAGAAYTWKEARGSTQLYVDGIYGSGLRNDSTDAQGNNIPNGGSVPSYFTLSTGIEQNFKLERHRTLKARLDIVNVTDEKYELRDGSGVGVNAAQFGMRRGIFGSLGLAF